MSLRYDAPRILESGHTEVIQWVPSCGSPIHGIRVTALGGARVEFYCGSEKAARELAAAHCAYTHNWDDWPDIVNLSDVLPKTNTGDAK